MNFIKIVLPKAIETIKEPYPENLLKRANLITIQEALQNIHFPKTEKDHEKAIYRMKFSEAFDLQLFYAYQNSVKDKQETPYKFTKVGNFLMSFTKKICLLSLQKHKKK